MAVKPFYQLHNLTLLAPVRRLRDRARQAHELIQKLEAGAEATRKEAAEATFAFLSLIGFYPGDTHTHVMVQDGNRFEVHSTNDSYDWKGWYTRNALLGPGSDRYAVTMSPQMAMEAIKQSWPKAVLTVGDGLEDKDDDYWVVVVREGGYDKKPLASGAATSTNKTVALMQAYVRMLDDVLNRCIAMIHEQKAVEVPGLKGPDKDGMYRVSWMDRSRSGSYKGFEYPWVIYDESHTIKTPKDPLPPEDAAWLLKVRAALLK